LVVPGIVIVIIDVVIESFGSSSDNMPTAPKRQPCHDVGALPTILLPLLPPPPPLQPLDRSKLCTVYSYSIHPPPVYK
jgi:hypothetical protein